MYVRVLAHCNSFWLIRRDSFPSLPHAYFILSVFDSLCFSNMVSKLSETSQPSKGTLIFFKHVRSVKLNIENHLLWKQQILKLFVTINSHFLESSSKPLKFLSSQDEATWIINPKYSEWKQQDQLLVSCLLSSMTEGILTGMVRYESASQIWMKLNLCFAAQTRAKVSQSRLCSKVSREATYDQWVFAKARECSR